jgi:hypothetical protein
MRSSAVALFVACWLTRFGSRSPTLCCFAELSIARTICTEIVKRKMNRGFMPPGCWLPLS